jgi:hypothetical protein
MARVVVSFVYTNDGDGNVEFGDIARSYLSVATLSPADVAKVRARLKVAYDAGDIMDVYVGKLRIENPNTIEEEMKSLGECLGP